MAEQSDVKKLELRIQELENQLKQFQAAAAPQDITVEELATFRKVSSALSFAGEWECGINECRPLGLRICRCAICRVCRACINECICGPCNICSVGGGGFSGFGG